jgi:hypothetical protein
MLGSERSNGVHPVNSERVTAAFEVSDRHESNRQLEFFDLDNDADVWRDESREV